MRNICWAVVSIILVCSAGCSLRKNASVEDGVSARALTPMEWAALSRPGPSHKLLEMFAGEWESEISFRSGPDEERQVSAGTSSIHWVLGDRFLQEDFQGEASGEKFQGMGLMGYDNGARQFKMVWIDSLNTALAVSSGRYNSERNVFEMTSDVYDPLLGGVKTVKSVLHIKSPDKYEFSMLDTAPNGREFTSFEMVYTRKK